MDWCPYLTILQTFQRTNKLQNDTTDPYARGQQKYADCTGLPVRAQSMHWCSGPTNPTECRGTQTPDGCSSASVVQNTADMKEYRHKRVHSPMCIIITNSPVNPNGTTKTLGIPVCVDNGTHQPHKFTNTSSRPVLMQLHKRAQQKASDRRPLTDAPVKVPYKKKILPAHRNI